MLHLFQALNQSLLDAINHQLRLTEAWAGSGSMGPMRQTSTVHLSLEAAVVDSGLLGNQSESPLLTLKLISALGSLLLSCVPCCSDGGINGTVELHLEDACSLMSDGGVNDSSTFLSLRTPYMCEIDLQCGQLWTRYVDDGSEGRDSCLTAPLLNNTRSLALASTWFSAVNIVPPGSHLLTIRPASRPLALAAAISAISTLTSSVFWAWCGAVQSGNFTRSTVGWNWIDGTPSDNLNRLNCGQAGCDLWYPGYPT